MATKGVVLFAHNNGRINYVRQAVYCARQIRRHLDLPTTLVTSTPEALTKSFKTVFKSVVTVETPVDSNIKTFRDARHKRFKSPWYNFNRADAYDVSPYDETIVMDTDYILANDSLLGCFKTNSDFQIWKGGHYINTVMSEWSIRKVSDGTIDMYWATVFYFRKTKKMNVFFNLVKHVRDNWDYYRYIYMIPTLQYRNDHAFSIAIHTMNGYRPADEWPVAPPGNLYYSYDRDELQDFDGKTFTVFLADTSSQNNMSVTRLTKENLHVMNKLSLERFIDRVI
jgi:hypothetical protein